MRPGLARFPRAHWQRLRDLSRIGWHRRSLSQQRRGLRAQGEGSAEVRGGLGLAWAGSATEEATRIYWSYQPPQGSIVPSFTSPPGQELEMFRLERNTGVGLAWSLAGHADLWELWQGDGARKPPPATGRAGWRPLRPGLQPPHKLHVHFQTRAAGSGLICRSPPQFTPRVARGQFRPGSWGGRQVCAGRAAPPPSPGPPARAPPARSSVLAGSSQAPGPGRCAASPHGFAGVFWTCGTSGRRLIRKLFLFAVVGVGLCKFRIWLSPSTDILYWKSKFTLLVCVEKTLERRDWFLYHPHI